MNNEMGLMKRYTKDLKTEIEGVKMFLTEQLYLFNASVNEPNRNESAENVKMIELLQQ